MYNKKVLSTATKNLNKVKAPAKPKDQVISKPVVSTQGYKQGPPPEGTHYRIPGNDGTTSIYNPTPYPLNLVGPNGTQAQIGPWDTTTQHFNEPYIDEFPVAAKGGSLPNIPKKKNSKGYSRSLMATNKLFAQNPLTKKPKSKKRKIFDPNSKYYQDGGARDIIWNQNLAKDDKEFQDWYWNNSQALEAASGTPYSEDFAYDYYSYFKNKDHLDTQGNPVDHYIDKYKRPQHPVFSDQSLYSTPENPGGHWETINGEEVLIPHQGLSLTKRNKKLGGFQDDINKHRDLLKDWTYGADIGMLHKAQFGDVGVRTSEEEIKRIQEAKAKELSYARTPAQKEEVTKRFDKLLQDAGYRVQMAKQQQKEAPKKVVKTIVDASDKAKAQRIAAEQKNLQNRTVGAGPGTSTYVTPTKIDVPVSLTPLEEKAIENAELQRFIDKGYIAEAYRDDIDNQMPTTAEYFAGVRPKKIFDNYYDLAIAKRYGDTDPEESYLPSFENQEKFDEDIEDAQYNIWKRGEQARYDQAPWYNIMLNELTSFIGDPVLATSNALSLKRNLYGQGYRSVAPEDFEDARFYDRANERTQAGLIGSNLVNMFNPGYYGGKAGHNIARGNYGEAVGDLGQAYLAGAYGGLAKGSLPGLSKLPGATAENLVKADMAASSLYNTPETLSTVNKIITGGKDEYGDPVTLDWLNALDLGLTAAGYKQIAPILKEGIPALKKVKVDTSKLKQIAPAVKSSLKKKLNRNNLNTIDLQGLTFAQGGQTSWEGEYTNEELEQLKRDGYQIEYLD